MAGGFSEFANLYKPNLAKAVCTNWVGKTASWEGKLERRCCNCRAYEHKNSAVLSTSLEVSLRLQSVQTKTGHSPNTLHHHSRGQTDSGTNDLLKKMTFARMLETRRRMARERKRAWYSFVIIKRM